MFGTGVRGRDRVLNSLSGLVSSSNTENMEESGLRLHKVTRIKGEENEFLDPGHVLKLLE